MRANQLNKNNKNGKGHSKNLKKSNGNSWESKPNPKSKRTEPNRALAPTKSRKNVPMQNEFQLQSAREKFIKKPSGGDCPLLNVFFIFRVLFVVFLSLFRENSKLIIAAYFTLFLGMHTRTPSQK